MKPRILLILAIMSLIVSCKKDKEDTPVPAVQHKLKTIATATGSPTNIEYDAQGRISKIIDGANRQEFSYSAGTLTENRYQGTVLTEQIVYSLNNSGMAITMTPQTSQPRQYTYNNLQQMLTDLRSDGRLSTHYYTGLNKDSTVVTDASSRVVQRWSFEYDPLITNTIGQDREGLTFLGSENQKAYRTRRIKHYDINGQLLNTQVNDFVYQIDSQGRITRSTMTGGTAHDQFYTYY